MLKRKYTMYLLFMPAFWEFVSGVAECCKVTLGGCVTDAGTKMAGDFDTRVQIKFPFKRKGLPCCEDEPGSEKIALKWKSSELIFWYLRYLFVLYANERYTKLYSNKLKCINFTKYKTKEKSFPFN